MKALLKYLPLFAILLLCGYSQAPIHTLEDNIAAYSSYDHDVVSKTPPPDSKRRHHKFDVAEKEIEENEVEEDNLDFGGKAPAGDVTHTFLTQTRYFFTHTNGLLSCKQTPYLLSYRYLILRVFRI